MLIFINTYPCSESDRDFITRVYLEFERLMFATAKRYISDLSICEDVEVGAAIINNYEAVTIVKRGIDGYGNSYERSQVVWFDTMNVFGVDITSYQENVETLVLVAENLILK